MLPHARKTYKNPKIYNDLPNIGFIYTSVEKKRGECCDKLVASFNCSLCEIRIKRNYSVVEHWKTNQIIEMLNESHKHENEIYATVNGMNIIQWWRNNVYDIVSNETIDKYKVNKDLIQITCEACNNNMDMCNFDKWFIRNVSHIINSDLQHKFTKAVDMVISRLILIISTHNEACRQFIELKISMLNNAEQERNRLSELIIEEENKWNSRIAIPEIDNSKFDHLFTAKLCDCKESINIKCKICGSHRRIGSYKYGNVVKLREIYREIVRKHLSGTKKVYFNYLDFVTPINKTFTFKNNVPHWTNDGYKCSICGVEYQMKPDKITVMFHIGTCIQEHNEYFAKNNYIC